MSVHVGSSWMSLPSLSVNVIMQFLPLSSGRGPIKLIVTESPHWSGIGSGCKGPYSFVVVDLFRWHSGQEATYPRLRSRHIFGQYLWLTKVTEQCDIIFRVTQFHPLTESRGSTETTGWIARKFIRNIHVYIIYSNI